MSVCMVCISVCAVVQVLIGCVCMHVRVNVCGCLGAWVGELVGVPWREGRVYGLQAAAGQWQVLGCSPVLLAWRMRLCWASLTVIP